MPRIIYSLHLDVEPNGDGQQIELIVPPNPEATGAN